MTSRRVAAGLFVAALVATSAAVAGQPVAVSKPTPQISAKGPQVSKVRYDTYAQCYGDTRVQCRAQHPGDNPAFMACWQAALAEVCAGLPGEP
ncbi:hypothetical protein [Brevundimonas sp.]|jgi:hypothetical protein|uniref:hypothetical protein n=1 Tax=Brevundimonas sp. TaxID=1871086 RepID=UPI0037BFF7B0